MRNSKARFYDRTIFVLFACSFVLNGCAAFINAKNKVSAALCSCKDVPSSQNFAGGDGSSTPYQVCSAEQLDRVRNFSSSKFVMTCDLDLTDKAIAPIPMDFDVLYLIVNGTLAPGQEAFTGEFDGKDPVTQINHTISNWNYVTNTDQVVGLFSTVSGTVKNLNIRNFSVNFSTPAISSPFFAVGGLAGMVLSGGTVASVSFDQSSEVVAASSLNNGVIGSLIGLVSGATLSSISATLNSDSAVRGPASAQVGGLIGSVSDFFGGGVSADHLSITANGLTLEGASIEGGLIGMVDSGSATSNFDTISVVLNDVSFTAPDASRVGGFTGVLRSEVSSGGSVTVNHITVEVNGSSQISAGVDSDVAGMIGGSGGATVVDGTFTLSSGSTLSAGNSNGAWPSVTGVASSIGGNDHWENITANIYGTMTIGDCTGGNGVHVAGAFGDAWGGTEGTILFKNVNVNIAGNARLEIGDDLSGCNSQIGGLVGYAGDGVILDGTQVVITDDAQLIGGRHSNIGGIAGGFDSGSDHANELKGNLNATLSGSAVISAESDAAFGSGSVGIGFASITSHANQMVTHPNAKFNISMLGTSVLKVTGDQFGRIGGLVGTFDGYSNGTSATPFGVGSTASPFVTINIGDGAGSAPIIRGIGDSEYIGGGTGVLNNVQVAGEWLVKVHSGAKILSSTGMTSLAVGFSSVLGTSSIDVTGSFTLGGRLEVDPGSTGGNVGTFFANAPGIPGSAPLMGSSGTRLAVNVEATGEIIATNALAVGGVFGYIDEVHLTGINSTMLGSISGGGVTAGVGGFAGVTGGTNSVLDHCALVMNNSTSNIASSASNVGGFAGMLKPGTTVDDVALTAFPSNVTYTGSSNWGAFVSASGASYSNMSATKNGVSINPGDAPGSGQFFGL